MQRGIAKQSCGRAGQPGYVFSAGDTVIVVPAINIPNGGYFVCREESPDNRIYLLESDLPDFVSLENE